MKGDFARSVFGPLRRLVGVLMQQGRVMLDADAPEPGSPDKQRSPTSPAKDQGAAKSIHVRTPD